MKPKLVLQVCMTCHRRHRELVAQRWHQMKRTLCHEIAHVLTLGHNHDEAWHRACDALWDAVFSDRQGFAEHITAYLGR